MPARSPACLRCAERQRGAAVVLALLTVTFAAMLAAAALADFGRGLEAVSGRRDQAQSRQLARAAVDWGRNVLEDDAKNAKTNISDNARQPWATVVPVFAVEEGELSGGIEEQSGRFNINSLVADNGAASVGQIEIFLRVPDPADRRRAFIAQRPFQLRHQRQMTRRQ